MKKSKKAEKELYNNNDLDTKPKCECGNTEHPEGDCDGSHKTKKKPRKMINRKAVQAEIDIDKNIRRLLRMGYYNYNQIASMVKGANLERVINVDNERRKN